MTTARKSFVEMIVEAYSTGLAQGLRNQANPWNAQHSNIAELEQAYAIGLRDGVLMRERKMRLDAGRGVYQ